MRANQTTPKIKALRVDHPPSFCSSYIASSLPLSLSLSLSLSRYTHFFVAHSHMRSPSLVGTRLSALSRHYHAPQHTHKHSRCICSSLYSSLSEVTHTNTYSLSFSLYSISIARILCLASQLRRFTLFLSLSFSLSDTNTSKRSSNSTSRYHIPFLNGARSVSPFCVLGEKRKRKERERVRGRERGCVCSQINRFSRKSYFYWSVADKLR